MNMGKTMTSLILGLLVTGILVAFLLPVAIDQITAVDTSAWGSDTADLWDLFPLFIILVPLIALIGYVIKVI